MNQLKDTQYIDDNVVYVFGDADQIRRTIEAYLFSQDLEGLREFSKSLTHAIAGLAKTAEQLGGEVIFAGGDDVLFRMPLSELNIADIRKFMKVFQENTGSTISVGVGATPEKAFVHLAKAKASGPGTLYFKNSADAKKKLTNKSSGRKKPRR
jgi:hypothetical protein